MSKNGSAASAGGADGRTEAPQWIPSPPDRIGKWLDGKTPADFSALEQEGRVLYPDVIQRRDTKKDQLLEVPVMLRVPLTSETVRARFGALDWVQKMGKLPQRPTKEQAEALIGADYFDDLDTTCLLEHCILDIEPMPSGVHPKYMTAHFLDKLHPRAALHDVHARLSFYQAIEDPRVHELTEAQFVQTVAAIARVRNLSPLVAIDGRAHGSFIASMAARLSTSPTQ